MRWCVVVFGLISTAALAQQVPRESKLHAELRREGERVGDACNFSLKAIPMCGYTLFTDHPLHIAAGSMPPQNGFGLGGAFVWTKNTHNWRTSYDFDAVGTTSGAWRAGGYVKLIHTPHNKKPESFTHPYTLFNLYAQSISLNKLNYFGESNNSSLAGASVFGMTQTIVGANAIKPVFELESIRKVGLSLLGEINGRFVSVRGEHGQSAPSTRDALHRRHRSRPEHPASLRANGAGSSHQARYRQHLVTELSGEIRRVFRTFELAQFFLALDGRPESHDPHIWPDQVRIHEHRSAWARFVRTWGDKDKCPEVPHTRNLSGFLTARLLVSESINSATSAVPFYLQQTLGGQGINSNLTLGSFRDYRFRAPNLLLLQESYGPSIWGPFGVKVMADEGRVALTRGDLGFSHFRHSYAAGLTLRAGAFPMVQLMFAWGGPDGHHNIFGMNSSLLGGSPRPLLD